MKRQTTKSGDEVRAAQRLWGTLAKRSRDSLTDLIDTFGVSVSRGDVQLIGNGWYITHAGLLRIAHRHGCFSLITNLETTFSDAASGRWVFKATVFKSPKSKGFVGYGDANPSNVSSPVRGSELRIAETRAVNRALRKAMELVFVRSKSWGRLDLRNRRLSTQRKTDSITIRMAPTTDSPDCAISFAF